MPAVALLSALSLIGSGLAEIVGIEAPSTIAPGVPFTVTLVTEDFIQSIYDVAVAFGIAPSPGVPESLGAVFASEYLGPALSNVVTPIDFTVQIDSSTPTGSYLLSASLFSLLGEDAEPSLSTFSVTVAVGTATSTTIVSSN